MKTTLKQVFLSRAPTTHFILWLTLLLCLLRLRAGATDVSTINQIGIIYLLFLEVSFLGDLRLPIRVILHLNVDVADLDAVEFI